MHSITEYRARKCRNFKRASLCCLACPHGRRCRNRFADHRTMFRRRDRKRTLAEPIRGSLVILSRARQPITSANWPTPALKNTTAKYWQKENKDEPLLSSPNDLGPAKKRVESCLEFPKGRPQNAIQNYSRKPFGSGAGRTNDSLRRIKSKQSFLCF